MPAPPSAAPLLAGWPVTLALSGGGAKCAAQAGAFAVLTAAGLEVGSLVGVSGGGLVAVLIALGWPPEAIRDFIAGTHLLDAWDFDPSRRALLSTDKMRARLDLAVGDRTFDELAVPVTLIAADLDQGEEIHLDHGRLDAALLATMAVPGLIEPASLGGRRLSDGGLLNPLPVDVAERWGRPVVALDVLADWPAPGASCQLFEAHGPVGFVANLGQRLGLSGLLDEINQAVLVTTGRLRQLNLRAHPPAVHLCPAVATVGLFAFDLAPFAYDQGALAARAALPTLLSASPARAG